MPLKHYSREAQIRGNAGEADQTYYLDKDGNLTDNEGEYHSVLVHKGAMIPKSVADKYGIGKVAQSDESESDSGTKAESPKSNKRAEAPENKAVKAPAKKAAAKKAEK